MSGTTSQFVPGVTISIAGRSDVTGSVGEYWIDRVPAGTQAVTATASSYESYSGSVQVVAGGAVQHSFSMTPAENRVELLAVADAYTNSLQPFTNYGSEQSLYTGSVNFGGAGSAEFRSFIRFDLSGIPRNAEIVEASLFLTVGNDSAPTKPTGTTTVQRVAGPGWTESGLTYFRRPSVFLSHLDNRQVTFGVEAFVRWTVTEAVRAWVNNGNPNYGLAVTTTGLNPSSAFAAFYSREIGGGSTVRLHVRYR